MKKIILKIIFYLQFFFQKDLQYVEMNSLVKGLTVCMQYTRGVEHFIYLFGVLRHFQHCTGHITTGSWKGRGNQYIQFVRVLYCKLPTNGKQLPAFPLEAVPGIEPRPQRWEARVWSKVVVSTILSE